MRPGELASEREREGEQLRTGEVAHGNEAKDRHSAGQYG
jgi:hypothetical protein